ncbi:3'(2'),5'-bisphosphate nucleotidase CysQ [Cytophagales bacterium LB-30]|uniref:3'(2'),5'-bisphosphate nucleotidase CysQ n=1 Tax=Shiella aurantiaca TaxID=3058365 RepID=A0ABT8F8R6_9BACT|nr:3'(2'),5'-bisphosphate nucleotidase CysQ [Shiella aurantiaca]MDN4166601.1 3'(2'),5'-bisphosphate nucleotidase CysQ [Shiella aurantiaca]
MDKNQLLQIALQANEAAAKAILHVYTTEDFGVEMKGDASPLTKADKAAHQEIMRFLETTGIPVLSEEGKNIPYEERKQWQQFWMVDPLDGTKEFIKRNGEFTVNIALIEGNAPVLGVVGVPVSGEVFYAIQGQGAFYQENSEAKAVPLKQSVADLNAEGLRIVASRSHLSEETEAFVNQLKNPEMRNAGSSLKFMLLAKGEADVYPRYAPTMEWDTAAAHIVVQEAGKKVLQKDTDIPLQYNKPDLLNPWFLVH